VNGRYAQGYFSDEPGTVAFTRCVIKHDDIACFLQASLSVSGFTLTCHKRQPLANRGWMPVPVPACRQFQKNYFITAGLSFPSLLELREVVHNLKISAFLACPDMANGFKIGRIVQGTSRHGNIFLSPGVPEKRRSALAAETAMNIGCFIRF
jgi:hypothetical protein